MLPSYLRRLGWLDVLTAVLVAVGAFLTAFESVLGGSALIAASLVVTQLVPRVLKWVGEQQGLLRIRRPITKVNPFEEVLIFPSALAQRGHEGEEPPYIHRDADSPLREALEKKRFVLVTGASKSGKSRTAFEAARNIEPEPTLLVPASPEALPKLLSRRLPVDRSKPSVLWLDDLDRYLQDPGMKRTLFDDLDKHDSRVVGLSTITLTARDRLRSIQGEIGRSAREILDLFEEIALPNEISPSELKEAHRLYPSQHFVAGIGEHFAAARELIVTFRTALETNRHGFAVVVAALDWRRAGLSRPITEAELRELYALCLKRFYPLLEANDSEYQDAVAWARHPLDTRAALLMPATEREGFEIFDYVRDWADGAGDDVDPRLHEVPESIWNFVVRHAGPPEVFAVGVVAYTRGNFDAAEDAWTKAADSGDIPEAAFNLGVLLEEQGHPKEAEEAYRQAIDSGHPDQAPMAALNLGNLLEEQGRPKEAEEAYKQAIDSGGSEDIARGAEQALEQLRTSRSEEDI